MFQKHPCSIGIDMAVVFSIPLIALMDIGAGFVPEGRPPITEVFPELKNIRLCSLLVHISTHTSFVIPDVYLGHHPL